MWANPAFGVNATNLRIILRDSPYWQIKGKLNRGQIEFASYWMSVRPSSPRAAALSE